MVFTSRCNTCDFTTIRHANLWSVTRWTDRNLCDLSAAVGHEYCLRAHRLVLCVLLCAACFLAVKRRRKRTHAKAVAPGRPHEERSQSEASRGPSALGASRGTIVRDPETVWTRPFSEVRAKSANAVLFISPFCVSGNQVTVENETEDQSEVTEKQADGKKEVENETGEIQAINITDKNQKESDDGRKMDENPHCASVGVDTVPYLSIGANQNKPNPDRLDEQPTDGVGQRSHVGKVLGRISTWPPTAVQWQARCQMTEEDEEERETGKSPSEVNQVERPSASDRDKTGDLVNQEPPKMNEALMESTHSRPSNLNYQGASLSQAQASADAKQEDQSAVRRTTRGTPGQGPGRPAHGDASESGGGKAEERNGRRPSATSRQRGSAKRSAGSKAAPSGGASPDDATLLRGNEYAFMDLLHEVVQHHGRWTRQRWRQSHVNKPRR
ncbi:putative flocculation protein FLO11-like [Scophthalmus maximus]|uniref:Putative flocculation protein FLO11-like n=1 Tax=Scophthalmus maximus TaxID=52904 RepID=A0A2U9BTK2_SCOMX|nr:putative flocculation protein FLO11-like [Scophthalmus maximus]